MKGCRALSTPEIAHVLDVGFDGKFCTRNRELFRLGVSTGGRISELLSLQLKHIWQNARPVHDLIFHKHMVKGKEHARVVPVNADGRLAIENLVRWHERERGAIVPAAPVFAAQVRVGARALTSGQAARVLKKAFEQSGLNGALATHSLRKSYAQRLYEETGDIYVLKEMLGHKSVATTEAYLGVVIADVRDASERMSVTAWQAGGTVPRAVRIADTPVLLQALEEKGFEVSLRRRGGVSDEEEG